MEHILDHLKKNDKEIFMKHYVEEDSVENIAGENGNENFFYIQSSIERTEEAKGIIFT